MPLHFELSAQRLSRWLIAAFLVLLAAHLLVVFGHFFLHKPLGALSTLFDMDLEANLPLYFNSMLFFIAAVLFHLCGRVEKNGKRWPWMFLALIFLFLGIDEGSQIHERFMLWTLRLISTPDMDNAGLLHYAWVIPYGAAVLVLAVVFTRFVLHLPPRTRLGLMASAAIYLGGAVLLEMVSGRFAAPLESMTVSQHVMDIMPCAVYPPGQCNLYLDKAYVISYTLEECLEILGLIYCIHTLMLVLGNAGTAVSVQITKNAAQHGE